LHSITKILHSIKKTHSFIGMTRRVQDTRALYKAVSK